MLLYPVLLIVAQRSRTVLRQPNNEVVASDPSRRIDLLRLRGLHLSMFFHEIRVPHNFELRHSGWLRTEQCILASYSQHL
jgi:hypothetical protein